MITARAFWVIAPGHGAIRSEQLSPPDADEVLVKTLASGVSSGTERLVFAGRVPPSEHERMRAPLQTGTFPAPVKYGYAAAGVVELGASPWQGRRVFCLHPHQDRFVVPTSMVVPVPDTVTDRRAILAANMETALNATWDAVPKAGERIAVVGLGVVGLLTAYLLGKQGHAPVCVDVDAGRRQLAASLELATDAPTAAGSFDLVVHASGNPDGLVWALERLDFEGRVIELSWYGDRLVTLPLGAAFHSRRLRIIGSQVGSVAPSMRTQVTHRERLVRALAQLDDVRLDALIDHVVPLEELPGLMADLAAGRHRVLCAAVTYNEIG